HRNICRSWFQLPPAQRLDRFVEVAYRGSGFEPGVMKGGRIHRSIAESMRDDGVLTRVSVQMQLDGDMSEEMRVDPDSDVSEYRLYDLPFQRVISLGSGAGPWNEG